MRHHWNKMFPAGKPDVATCDATSVLYAAESWLEDYGFLVPSWPDLWASETDTCIVYTDSKNPVAHIAVKFDTDGAPDGGGYLILGVEVRRA